MALDDVNLEGDDVRDIAVFVGPVDLEEISAGQLLLTDITRDGTLGRSLLQSRASSSCGSS